MHSGVICLCDGKLDVLYFAVTRCETMNHFNYLYYFELTCRVMVGDFCA